MPLSGRACRSASGGLSYVWSATAMEEANGRDCTGRCGSYSYRRSKFRWFVVIVGAEQVMEEGDVEIGFAGVLGAEICLS
jgi:hypothetical protein